MVALCNVEGWLYWNNIYEKVQCDEFLLFAIYNCHIEVAPLTNYAGCFKHMGWFETPLL